MSDAVSGSQSTCAWFSPRSGLADFHDIIPNQPRINVIGLRTRTAIAIRTVRTVFLLIMFFFTQPSLYSYDHPQGYQPDDQVRACRKIPVLTRNFPEIGRGSAALRPAKSGCHSFTDIPASVSRSACKASRPEAAPTGAPHPERPTTLHGDPAPPLAGHTPHPTILPPSFNPLSSAPGAVPAAAQKWSFAGAPGARSIDAPALSVDTLSSPGYLKTMISRKRSLLPIRPVMARWRGSLR